MFLNEGVVGGVIIHVGYAVTKATSSVCAPVGAVLHGSISEFCEEHVLVVLGFQQRLFLRQQPVFMPLQRRAQQGYGMEVVGNDVLFKMLLLLAQRNRNVLLVLHALLCGTGCLVTGKSACRNLSDSGQCVACTQCLHFFELDFLCLFKAVAAGVFYGWGNTCC